ncbi:MAG TPA: helical backbone metal receptor [Prolixibacteraceae bacterium]|nr:helical backbone metal receptor [Prolixibacteraceae bacterium]
MNITKIKLIILLIFMALGVWAQAVNRVISLAPSITKNIYFLEAQDKLVACTSYCTEAINDKIEVVASAVKVNIEKVVMLKPDLVLVTSITSPETIEMIQKFGIRVEVFETPKSFEQICVQFIELGVLLGKSALANEIVKASKEKIETFSKKKLLLNETTIFFQIGARPLFTVLPKTFMDDYITLIGARNLAEGFTQGSITRESVITKNPDVIFIVTMGIVGNEEKTIWEGYQGMKAAENQKIFIIDAEKACSPTPITFIETLETIVTLMNLETSTQ